MTRHDDGVTLVELLVGLAMLSIIFGAITTATIVGLNTSGEAEDKLGQSAAARIAAAYFGPDVAAAATVSEQACPAAAGIPLVTMNDVDGNQISWLMQTSPASTPDDPLVDLVRDNCSPDARSTKTVFHGLTSATAQCLPDPCADARTVEISLRVAGATEDTYVISGTRRIDD